MPKPTTILVSALVMVLLVAVGGCIEQRDPPPEGSFTMTMETDVVMYAYEGQPTDVHGPHAEVETELHHEHPDYSWSIEGMAHHEGSDVHVDGGNVGLREATYHLDYYEQRANVSMVLATVPDALGTYVVVAELPGEEWNSTATTELVIEPVVDLDEIHSEAMGKIMERPENWSEGMSLNISLDADAEGPVTYIIAFQLGTGINASHFERALVIHPGLHHHITNVVSMDDIHITVANTTTPDMPFREGTYEDLPSSYIAHPGHLEWEGEVGETDDAPGPGGVITLSALFVAVVLVRRRQSV